MVKFVRTRSSVSLTAQTSILLRQCRVRVGGNCEKAKPVRNRAILSSQAPPILKLPGDRSSRILRRYTTGDPVHALLLKQVEPLFKPAIVQQAALAVKQGGNLVVEFRRYGCPGLLQSLAIPYRRW